MHDKFVREAWMEHCQSVEGRLLMLHALGFRPTSLTTTIRRIDNAMHFETSFKLEDDIKTSHVDLGGA